MPLLLVTHRRNGGGLGFWFGICLWMSNHQLLMSNGIGIKVSWIGEVGGSWMKDFGDDEDRSRDSDYVRDCSEEV